MLADSDSRYVLLKNGSVLAIEPLLLTLDLERRGFRLERDDDDIVVSPFSKLTDDDVKNLRAWKPDILRIIDLVRDSVTAIAGPQLPVYDLSISPDETELLLATGDNRPQYVRLTDLLPARR